MLSMRYKTFFFGTRSKINIVYDWFLAHWQISTTGLKVFHSLGIFVCFKKLAQNFGFEAPLNTAIPTLFKTPHPFLIPFHFSRKLVRSFTSLLSNLLQATTLFMSSNSRQTTPLFQATTLIQTTAHAAGQLIPVWPPHPIRQRHFATVLRIRIRIRWIPVFLPSGSGSGSISQRYGSGAFLSLRKIVRKAMISTVL